MFEPKVALAAQSPVFPALSRHQFASDHDFEIAGRAGIDLRKARDPACIAGSEQAPVGPLSVELIVQIVSQLAYWLPVRHRRSHRAY
jgi:hypothetical protein